MPLLTTVRAFVLLVLSATVLAIAAAAQAQVSIAEKAFASVPPASPALPDLPTAETIRKRVDEVNVVFTVTNPGGHFVSNLSLHDLEVLDNRRPPEKISYFHQQADLPLRVALLVDLSDSIVSRFGYEKRAAAAFLKKVLRPQLDQAFLVGFGSDIRLFQDFTGDIDMLSGALRKMKTGGNTKLYDAIQFAAEKLLRGADATVSRNAIILISDGVDTYSHALLYDAGQSALRAQVMMYALSTNDVRTEGYTRGEAVLELLTTPTGGKVLPANTEGQMARAFDSIKEALRRQYVVAYKPADFQPDGTFRTIKIVPRNRSLLVNCRRGYFAPHEDSDSASHALTP
jgi:Ca-activated chloride channel family protein